MEVNRVIAGEISYRYKEFDSLTETLTFLQADEVTPAVDFTDCTFELVITKKVKTGENPPEPIEVETFIFTPPTNHEVKFQYLPGLAAGYWGFKFKATTAGGIRLTYLEGEFIIEK